MRAKGPGPGRAKGPEGPRPEGPKRGQSGRGKNTRTVKFPVLTTTTTIHSLVTSMSWFPFTLLGLSSNWLAQPPSQWDRDPDYREMEKFARSVKLTNDIAERGVKLISDYSDKLTKDS